MSEIEKSNVIGQVLKILFGVGLFCAVAYLLLDSTILDVLEGVNLDGSNSLTWRSGIAAAVLLLDLPRLLVLGVSPPLLVDHLP